MEPYILSLPFLKACYIFLRIFSSSLTLSVVSADGLSHISTHMSSAGLLAPLLHEHTFPAVMLNSSREIDH